MVAAKAASLAGQSPTARDKTPCKCRLQVDFLLTFSDLHHTSSSMPQCFAAPPLLFRHNSR